MLGELTGLVAVIMIFGVPMVAVYTEHRRKLLQMQLDAKVQTENGWREEAAKLRNEINALRDTSTRFDLSLEDSLERVEQRLQNVEIRTLPTVNAEERSHIQSGR